MIKIIDFRISIDGKLQYLPANGSWTDIPYEVVNTLLTSDQLAAIRGANNPSTSNVFVTGSSNVAELTSNTIDWSEAAHFIKTLTENTELFDENLPEYPVVKKVSLTINGDNNTLTLPSYYKVTDGTYDGSKENYIKLFCEDNRSRTKVDTITLAGTAGSAVIELAGGLTKVASFTTSLTITATNFVNTNASAYLAQKIIITSSGPDIIFTAQYPGYDFTSPTITGITGNMTGSVVHTTANGTGTAQVETITISGTDGKVIIASAGGLTKNLTFNTDIPTSITDFVTSNSAEYSVQGITLSANTNDLVMTSNNAGTEFTAPTKTSVAGDLSGDVTVTQANVVAVAQISTIAISGTGGAALITGVGGLTNSVIFDTDLNTTAANFVTNQGADYTAVGITVTSDNANIIFTANVAGTSFATPVITTDWGDLTGTVTATQANVVAVKQVETITLTGTDGEALVEAAGGLSKEVRFLTDLTAAATAFVAQHASAYLTEGIVVTSSTNNIIFTATTAGTGFTSPTITNTPWDLDATIVHTQANVAKVAQVETLTIAGTAGKFTVTGTGSLSKVGEYTTSLTQTATNFVTLYAANYLTAGVVLTSSGADIIFTSATAGTSIIAPTFTAITNDMGGTVVNTTTNLSPKVWCSIKQVAS